jgi:four helix bundle protein
VNQEGDFGFDKSVAAGIIWRMNQLGFAMGMQRRTKAFAVQVINFFVKLPKTDEARIVGRQLLRSGTSVAANYRAVCRAKSRADFISKMGTVVEETDETLLWLELLEEAEVCANPKVKLLKTETDELLLIFATSLATAKSHRRSNSLIH